MKRTVAIFGKDTYSHEQTIGSTGRYPEFTWRELRRIQPVQVLYRPGDSQVTMERLPQLYDEVMRFRIIRRDNWETEVWLIANEYTQAKEDRCIWKGHAMFMDALNHIAEEALYG